ncbi:MAG: hypothetical protein R3F43_21570 [bacterium]
MSPPAPGMAAWAAFIQRAGLVASCHGFVVSTGSMLRRRDTVFSGKWQGHAVSLAFGPEGVLLCVETSQEGQEFRAVSAASVPVTGLPSGDADFDARVALFGDAPVLARLDARGRAIVAAIVEEGAWLEAGGAGIGPPATERIRERGDVEALVLRLAEAHALLKTDLLSDRLLAELPTAPPGVRGAVVATIDDRVRRFPTASLIEAIARPARPRRPAGCRRWPR